MNTVLVNKGHPKIVDEKQRARDANFRSLDFSETALRLENEIGRELIFDAGSMRRIETVKDVLDFFEEATKAT